MGAATELWQILEHAIAHYTGLSPAAFFTVLAVALAFYYVVSGLFAAPPPPPVTRREADPEPLAPPVQLGEVEEEELKAYDGSDPKKPLLMAIKGQIYDVTQSRMFYGPGGPYALFAGKDASRALAKMSFEEKDLTGDISDLGPFEIDALNDWEYKFMGKYTKVGTIKKAVTVADGNASETAEASTQTTERELAEGQAEHVAESKEDTPSVNVAKTEEDTPADEDAVSKHVAESKEDTPSVKDTPADEDAVPKHVAESKEDTPSVNVAKTRETPADEDAVSKHVADEDAEAKHVAEPKEVAVEDSTKEIMAKSNAGAASSSTGTSPDPPDRDMPSSSVAKNCPAPSSSKKRKQSTSAAPETQKEAAAERSWVWSHVSKITIKETKEIEKDGKKELEEVCVLKAQCNYCGQIFACDTKGGGTSTYSKHILKVCKKYKPTEDLQQKVLGIRVGGDGDVKNLLTCRGWSQEASVKAIAKFIVIDEQPFSIVEKEGFKQMMGVVQPRLCVPSRRTIVRELWRMYDDTKEGLKKDISKYRVSLTTDTWSSVQNINYMVLTAHFVDDDWKMHKRIINFCPITSHQGKEIGKLIEQCLVEWKIEKIMCISVDNASANKVAIEWLVGKLKKWVNSPLILEGKYVHVRCLAHIINLVVKDGLKRLDRSVAAIRKAVKFVRSSPSRLAYFKKCIEAEKLDQNGLVVMDVATRWNSTYLMLESVLKYQKAFDRMCEDEDNAYLGYFTEKDEVCVTEDDARVGPPIEKDWESALVFCNFLKVFYLVTIKVSANKYPTAHTAFHDVIAVESEIHKLFLPKYNQYFQVGGGVQEVLTDMAVSMRAKYEKYFGSTGTMNQLFIVALVLDPRFKLRHYLHLCKKKMGYTDEEVEVQHNRVKALMKELCDAYAIIRDGSQYRGKGIQYSCESMSESSSSFGRQAAHPTVLTETPMIFDEMMMDWEKELEATHDVVLSHEVDSYLIDRLEPNNKNDRFDILKWWRVKGKNSYPILALVAKDVLAIQVSTVASESAFSTGGRVIDPFRSSLTPKSVEALICLQNWLKSEDISHIEYEASATELEFYQECESEYQRGKGESISSTTQNETTGAKNKGVVI